MPWAACSHRNGWPAGPCADGPQSAGQRRQDPQEHPRRAATCPKPDNTRSKRSCRGAYQGGRCSKGRPGHGDTGTGGGDDPAGGPILAPPQKPLRREVGVRELQIPPLSRPHSAGSEVMSATLTSGAPADEGPRGLATLFLAWVGGAQGSALSCRTVLFTYLTPSSVEVSSPLSPQRTRRCSRARSSRPRPGAAYPQSIPHGRAGPGWPPPRGRAVRIYLQGNETLGIPSAGPPGGKPSPKTQGQARGSAGGGSHQPPQAGWPCRSPAAEPDLRAGTVPSTFLSEP